jgi:hypothetical protein
MMEKYPDGWFWTNGIQQERARMLLVLAWLLRVEDTPEHRAWLDRIATDIGAARRTPVARSVKSSATLPWATSLLPNRTRAMARRKRR